MVLLNIVPPQVSSQQATVAATQLW